MFLDDFRRAQHAAHLNARDKGFYQDDDILEDTGLTQEEYHAFALRLVLARLAMIGEEVGEAVQAVRSYGDLGSELADIVIRTMDLAEYQGIDLAAKIEAKMEKNRLRPRMHGKLA